MTTVCVSAGAARLAGGLLCLAALFLSGCTLGPAYQRPALVVGDQYAHAPQGQWIRATPAPGRSTAWWRAFEDPVLDTLMQQLAEGSFDLAQAQAQYRQARAALDSARAGFSPTVGTAGSVERSGRGDSGPDNPATQYSVSATVSWEPDLWGRIRGQVDAARADAQASAADLAAVHLSLQATLARAYFSVRASEHQDALLERTLQTYDRALALTRNRLAAGVASPADVAAARAQYEQTRVQRIRLSWQREQQRHAIAVLLGQTPAEFRLPDGAESLPPPPGVPVGVPSALLQDRPDIAAAERRVASANAQIGVARTAWFPDLTLSGQAGYRATRLASWLSLPARFWTLGPALAVSLFDGGARSATLASARAAYDVQAASYRKTVLGALQEVEDALIQSQALVDEQQAQQQALDAARETLRQTLNQYQAGLVDYLGVVQAQTSALAAAQNALDLRLQRLDSAVDLVTALGGGWQDQSSSDVEAAPASN